ncbi:MAG TPA: TIGR04283 family arsenosugar biosynthesis glycosyltransferase [Gemmatimonadaceae bacterium]|nr:TIGR04283 family arsenosugar biosynthesis glycosyltransferase [Gemmatimonadaceae bacterium]
MTPLSPSREVRPTLNLSVIVPTFNEEAVIADTLHRAVSVVAPHELIVADAGSVDRTAALARPWATVLALPMTRGAALNRAATMATGDVLLFLHADTMLPVGAAAAIARALQDRGVIGGAFRLRLDHPGPLAALVAYNANLRSSLLNTFFGDQAMFVRRDVFARAGGFKDWSVMEDLEILARLRRHGRLALLDLEVVTSARRHQRSGWLTTIGIIWIMTILNRLGVPGQAMIRWYKPHR